MSNLKRVLNEFNRLGYIINNNGEVFSKDGTELKGCVVTYKGNTKYRKIGFRVFQFPSYSLKIHKLQAFKKFGDKIFEQDIVIRHLNGISTNNTWENIGIGSQSDNLMDIPKDIRIKRAKHASSFKKVKYNKEKVKEFHSKNNSYKKTMEEFNISSSGTLNYILKT